jgi:hypothetical protein
LFSQDGVVTQIETTTSSPRDPSVTLPATTKRRVRTEFGRLKREAERRRNRANAIMVSSIVATLALVRFFYFLLTR